MSVSSRLYQLVADTVRGYGGREGLVDELYACVLDELEAHVAARVEEVNNTSRIPYDSDRLGHTEQQAAQRWCPHAREVTPIGKSKKDAAIGNRYLSDEGDFTNPAGCRCIASHCMAWRWITEIHGFCGLAGPVGPMPRNEPRRLRNRKPPARLDPVPPQLNLFDDGAGDRRHNSADLPMADAHA